MTDSTGLVQRLRKDEEVGQWDIRYRAADRIESLERRLEQSRRDWENMRGTAMVAEYERAQLEERLAAAGKVVEAAQGMADVWRERISVLVGGRELAEALAAVTQERDAERALREKAEAQYALLRRAVNDSGVDCTPECDSYGHAEDCKTHDPAAWLVKQQDRMEKAERMVAALRARLEAVLRDIDTVAGLGPVHRNDFEARQIEKALADTATVATEHDARIRKQALEEALAGLNGWLDHFDNGDGKDDWIAGPNPPGNVTVGDVKTVPCKGCGKPIVWATVDGKRIPLDPRPPTYFFVLGLDGEPTAAQRANGEEREALHRRLSTVGQHAFFAMVSHFATCAKASEFSGSRLGQKGGPAPAQQRGTGDR